jgi:hypothetical protein
MFDWLSKAASSRLDPVHIQIITLFKVFLFCKIFFYFLLLAFARQPSVVEADPFLAFSTEDIEGMDKEVA